MVQYMQFVAAWFESLKVREDEGQGMVEYGLILALVSVIAIVALQAVGGGVVATLGEVAAVL